jgi:hypothetical protein
MMPAVVGSLSAGVRDPGNQNQESEMDRSRIVIYTLVGWALLLAIPPLMALETRPVSLDLEEDWRVQMADLAGQIDQRDQIFGVYESRGLEIYNRQATILESDRTPVDVILRRTEAMLNDLAEQGAVDPAKYRARLEALRERAADLPDPDVTPMAWKMRGNYEPPVLHNEDEFLPLFTEVAKLKREIALQNPLLDFDRIAFCTRYPVAQSHMCDEWYGRVAEPGGGLYILNNPGRDDATVTDLIAGNPVQNGQFEGQVLEPGAFITPEVDYDGETIYFAYTGNKQSYIEQWRAYGEWKDQPRDERGPRPYDKWEDYFHSPETAYHLFRIGVDGSGLTQLTEGTWNDFYPAVLPSGRIVFLSERRGGEGRCHPRPCPTYVMHSMLPDGSDIVPISYHEINEWSPVVTNDGRIVYSRWDYVDRPLSKGQYPWFSDPDGRDVRAFYGNYEGGGGSVHADLRPVPDSPLYFGTEYGHHSSSWGTLIVAAPSHVDEGTKEGQMYLTPEIGPYHRYNNRGAFATPYPLSESYYLAVWSPDQQPPSLIGNTKFYEHPDVPHGIYLVDEFGNRTLLYRDPEVPCNLPYPVRERERPPVIPHQTATGAPPGQEPLNTDPGTARMAVMDVYDSMLPWPEDRRIKGLRIVQVLPKSTPGASRPAIAYDSELVARQVLGTVPVEDDGSAHFVVPAGKPMFFQALDENGLAIQSMRTSTYAMPGETVTCQGCHEPKDESPTSRPRMDRAPLAVQRAPSQIMPGPPGSKPMTFPRLVQPILDEKCVKCHLDNPEKAPDLRATGKLFPKTVEHAKEVRLRTRRRWTNSYVNLLPYTFAYLTRRNVLATGEEDPGDGYRSVPGKVGAYVAPLYGLLHGSHEDRVDLTDEEMERIVTWLDTQSVFYGAYRDTHAQKKGELVEPLLE